MKNLTDSAQNRLDKYLSQARTSLHTCTSVDADEVERDIREHIETELQGMSEPVSLKDLEVVLDRLGSPSQWVPEEEIPWWRKIILRLRTGPEDWRLAYISFALFLLALLLGGEAFLVLLLASFCISRAVVASATELDELRGKKWLIYPSLITVYAPILLFILLWPLILFFGLPYEFRHWLYLSDHTQLGLARVPYNVSASPLLIPIFVGLWWTILGIIGCTGPRLFKVIFRPFADQLKRKWAGLLLAIGLLMVLIPIVVWFLFAISRGYFTHRGFIRPF